MYVNEEEEANQHFTARLSLSLSSFFSLKKIWNEKGFIYVVNKCYTVWELTSTHHTNVFFLSSEVEIK